MENSQPQKRKNTFVARDSANKAIVFTFIKLIEAPLERILAIKQTQQLNSQFDTLKKTRFKSYAEIGKDIFKNQGGYKSFWRGIPPIFPSCIGLFFTSSISITNGKLFYQYLQFVGLTETTSMLPFLAVTSFAHVAQTSILYPLHVIQTQLNVDIGDTQKQRKFVSMGDVIQRLPKLDPVSKNLLHSFYRGYIAYNLTGLIYINSFLIINKYSV